VFFTTTTIFAFSFELQLIMPCRPLVQINGNKTNRKELTTYTRGLIIGKHESGVSMTHISQTPGIPISTISYTIQQVVKGYLE
jgi:hypothetical protein